jgi:hypothetical protein
VKNNIENDDTFDLSCTVVAVGPARTTDKGFRFRELLVATNNKRFPQTVPVQLSGPRVDAAGTLHEGEEIVLTFSLRGREYNGKHYVAVDGWKIQRYDAAGNLYVVAPPDTSQPTLFPAAPPAPAPPPVEPWSATRTYRPGDRAILEGKVCVYRATPGGAQWTIDPGAAANATPAGTLDDVPF